MSANDYLIKKYQGNYNDKLFYNIYSSSSLDKYSRQTFIQILRYITRLPIVAGDYIVDNNGRRVNEFSLTLRDRLNVLREQKIVKLLIGQRVVYEVRINSEYQKERILFFVSQSPLSNNTVVTSDNMIFSFYFDKYKDGDVTNELAQETQDIYNNPYKITDVEKI